MANKSDQKHNHLFDPENVDRLESKERKALENYGIINGDGGLTVSGKEEFIDFLYKLRINNITPVGTFNQDIDNSCAVHSPVHPFIILINT